MPLLCVALESQLSLSSLNILHVAFQKLHVTNALENVEED